MSTKIEVSASAYAELANALRVLGIGSKNGALQLRDVEIVRGKAPDHFNKFEISVLQAISYVLPISLGEMKRETVLNADSLDLVELVIAIEDQLGISINDEDVPSSFSTVQDVLSFAERHKCRT